MSIYYSNLWVSILLGFPRLREYLYMWFDVLFGTWDNILSAVGVDHLGSTQSGGSAFYSYHWDPSIVTMARAFLVGIYLHFVHGSLWCMVISFMMDVISLLMDGCIRVWWMVSFTLLHLYHGSEEDDEFYFYICIFF